MRKIQLTVLILLAAALSTLLAALLSALAGLLCLLTGILLLAALLSALAGLLWLLTRILLLTTLILLVHRVLLFGSDNVQRLSVLYGPIDCRRANTLRGNLDRAVPLFLHLRQFISLRNEITGKAVLGAIVDAPVLAAFAEVTGGRQLSGPATFVGMPTRSTASRQQKVIAALPIGFGLGFTFVRTPISFHSNPPGRPLLLSVAGTFLRRT